jgi:hypothetical protein
VEYVSSGHRQDLGHVVHVTEQTTAAGDRLDLVAFPWTRRSLETSILSWIRSRSTIPLRTRA